ncbi:MAG TPA: DUF2834 domain-containing protein [Luteimonas sp.]|nr:DUF2834 domain-containing protein [Luteimonas sp.]
MRIVYALLCILGAAWPLAVFLPWLSEHGFDLPLLVRQAAATPVSAFAWTDVLVSAIAFAAFAAVEGRRLAMRRWWLSLLGLAVGVSLALPWFLWLRQRHLDALQRP